MAEAQNNIETPTITPEQQAADKLYPAKTETPPPAEPNAEVKPAEEKPADSTKAEEKPTEDLKEVTLPKDSMMSKADLEVVMAYAKENGLTNKQAQALVEKQNEQLNGFLKSQVDAYQAKVDGYEDAIKSDKEIGGVNYNKSVTLAKRVLEKFGTPDLKAEFDMSGFGSHPEVVRLLSRIGNSIGDDSLIMPNAKPAPQAKSLAEKLYGSSNN